MKKMYNLKSIMNRAWRLFKEGFAVFAECLRSAWREAKEFAQAIRANLIDEEIHTWYGWKELGYEVIHGSKNVFQVTIIDTKTKNGTRVISYFTKSQVAVVEEN